MHLIHKVYRKYQVKKKEKKERKKRKIRRVSKGKMFSCIIIISSPHFHQKGTFTAEDSIMSETGVIFQERVFRIQKGK